MKKGLRFLEYTAIAAVLLAAILFVIKFGGPSILRLYVETGIGNCKKIPILCMFPEGEIINPQVNKEYSAGLVPYTFPKTEIYLPKGFTVIKQRIKKVYYKRRKPEQDQPVVYIIRQEPNFFVNLYPQLKKQGITDDYEFVKRVMYARPTDIKDLTSAFFTIMKGIFTPDLGEQKNVKMEQFTVLDKKGFINYNLTGPDHYFDCNIFNASQDYFKVYIKDKGANLDLDKVLTIISTVN